MSNLETWRNTAKHRIGVFRDDRVKGEVWDVVDPGKEFTIRTDDRLRHESQIRREANNPYMNGAFQPVVIEGAPDLERLQSNPNFLPLGDIEKLFKRNLDNMRTELAKINSLPTLTHIHDHARKLDISAGRVELITERIAEVKRDQAKAEQIDGSPEPGENLPAPEPANPGDPGPQDADFYDMGPQEGFSTV